MNIRKLNTTQIKASLYTAAISFLLWCADSHASLTKLNDKGTELNKLVTGPIGTSVLLIGTIGGFVGAFMKGNIWLGVAILIVGMLAGVHVENVKSLFDVANVAN